MSGLRSNRVLLRYGIASMLLLALGDTCRAQGTKYQDEFSEFSVTATLPGHVTKQKPQQPPGSADVVREITTESSKGVHYQVKRWKIPTSKSDPLELAQAEFQASAHGTKDRNFSVRNSPLGRDFKTRTVKGANNNAEDTYWTVRICAYRGMLYRFTAATTSPNATAKEIAGFFESVNFPTNDVVIHNVPDGVKVTISRVGAASPAPQSKPAIAGPGRDYAFAGLEPGITYTVHYDSQEYVAQESPFEAGKSVETPKFRFRPGTLTVTLESDAPKSTKIVVGRDGDASTSHEVQIGVPMSLEPGSYTLRAEAGDNYDTDEQKVEISPNQAKSLTSVLVMTDKELLRLVFHPVDDQTYKLLATKARSAATHKPTDSIAHSVLALALYHVNGSDESAALESRKALDTAKTRSERAYAYNAQGLVETDKEKQQSLFQQAVGEDNTLVDALVNLGKAYSDGRQFPLAAECFRNAKKYDPANGDIYVLLAGVLIKQNQIPQAKDELSAALKKGYHTKEAGLAAIAMEIVNAKVDPPPDAAPPVELVDPPAVSNSSAMPLSLVTLPAGLLGLTLNLMPEQTDQILAIQVKFNQDSSASGQNWRRLMNESNKKITRILGPDLAERAQKQIKRFIGFSSLWIPLDALPVLIVTADQIDRIADIFEEADHRVKDIRTAAISKVESSAAAENEVWKASRKKAHEVLTQKQREALAKYKQTPGK